jgi:hypothetical protein
MIPYILAAVGGYLIGDSMKGKLFANGGKLEIGKPDYQLTEQEYIDKYVNDKYDIDLAKEDYKNIIDKAQSDIVFDGKDYWWQDLDEGIWWKLDKEGEITIEQSDDKPKGKTISSFEYDKLKYSKGGLMPNDTFVGKRIKLIAMNDEPYPVEPNTLGTIRHIDGLGQIHVEWDNGRTLAVIPEIDEYEIIDEFADGGEISSFEKKIKDVMKEENKWHFINEEFDGKVVQLKMFVGKKEVDVQIFKINGKPTKMPRNYVGKRETLKMILDNFNHMANGGYLAKGGKIVGYEVVYEKVVDGERETDIKSFKLEEKEAAEKFAKKNYGYVENVYESQYKMANGGWIGSYKKPIKTSEVAEFLKSTKDDGHKYSLWNKEVGITYAYNGKLYANDGKVLPRGTTLELNDRLKFWENKGVDTLYVEDEKLVVLPEKQDKYNCYTTGYDGIKNKYGNEYDVTLQEAVEFCWYYNDVRTKYSTKEELEKEIKSTPYGKENIIASTNITGVVVYKLPIQQYAKGGTIEEQLEKINVYNDLDEFEYRQYKRLTESGMSKVDALKVIINDVEGDTSQLSKKLASVAKKIKYANGGITEDQLKKISSYIESYYATKFNSDAAASNDENALSLRLSDKADKYRDEANNLIKSYNKKNNTNFTFQDFNRDGSLREGISSGLKVPTEYDNPKAEEGRYKYVVETKYPYNKEVFITNFSSSDKERDPSYKAAMEILEKAQKNSDFKEGHIMFSFYIKGFGTSYNTEYWTDKKK